MSSVKQRKDGMWRARYRDDAGKEHSKHFPTKKAGEAWLTTVEVDKKLGVYVDPKEGRLRLSEFYAEWSQRQLWATGTKRAMDIAMRDCTFADVPLNLVRRSHVETWVKSMTLRLAASTVKTRFNNVRSVLRAAVADEKIGKDPAANVTLPRIRRLEHTMTVPTPGEVGRLIAAADERWVAYIALCAFAGLRLGEASGVQLADIDFLRRSLKVRRQVQRAGGGEVEVTLPKYGSERVVFLPDALLEMLSQHVERGVVGRERWLFGTGNPPHQNTVGYAFRKFQKSAGLEGFTLHDLRHFYASGLIAAGCDVVTVQRALGHKKATTTLNTYAHLWPTAEDNTRKAAAGLLADSLRTSDPSEGSKSLQSRGS